VSEAGDYNIVIQLAPTIDFHNQGGLKFAVSMDNQEPRIINMHRGESNRAWEESVANNVRVSFTRLKVDEPGQHTLKIWLVDPGVVYQKIIISKDRPKPSYLGPPESFFRK